MIHWVAKAQISREFDFFIQKGNQSTSLMSQGHGGALSLVFSLLFLLTKNCMLEASYATLHHHPASCLQSPAVSFSDLHALSDVAADVDLNSYAWKHKIYRSYHSSTFDALQHLWPSCSDSTDTASGPCRES